MVRFCEYTNPSWGIAFKKITNAFRKHSPEWVEWVSSPHEADIYIVHVVGEGEKPELDREVKNKIIVQQCYFTAQLERVDYTKYWERALLTVSFHDLRSYTDKDFRFLRLPWGADETVFVNKKRTGRFIDIFCTGHVPQDECLDKVFEAVKRANKKMAHTGRNLCYDTKHYRYLDFLPETTLADMLNFSKYISCLRLIEGFEILGIEGLFCGARPIIFDLPTYDLYRKHAITISSKEDVVEQLVEVLNTAPEPVSDEERVELVATFSWKSIITKFFDSVKALLF